MGQRDAAHAVGEALEVVLPAVGGRQVDVGVAVQLVDHGLHDAVEQVLPSGHIAVERHGLHAEVGAEAPHRQSVEPLLVDELDGRAEDAAAVQPAAAGAGGGRGDDARGSAAALGAVGVGALVGHRVRPGHRPTPFAS
jgi:hypothetical protein